MARIPANGKALRAAIYVRVSSDRQEQDGTSLDSQDAACREYAARQGWTVSESHVIREVFSGFALHERPGVIRLRDLVRAGEIDILLSYAVDRLSRKQTHLAIIADEAERHGIKLAFVTESFEESAVGEFIRSAKAFAAEVELEKIRERTVRGARKRIENGSLPGKRLPFGLAWHDERDRKGNLVKARAVEDTSTAWVVRRIFAEVVDGKSLRSVARDLAADGVPTASGGFRWTRRLVHSVVDHPFYKGLAAVDRVKTERVPGSTRRTVTTMPESEWIVLPEGTVPQIVPPAVWQAAQDQLKRNAQASPRRNANVEDTLLRAGHIFCGRCGDAMCVNRRVHRSRRRARYICQRAVTYADSCARHTIEAHLIDDAVWTKISAVLSQSGTLRAEIEQMESAASPTTDIEALDRRIATVAKQIESSALSLVRLQDAPAAATAIEAQLRQLAKEQEELETERDLVAVQANTWQEREDLLRTLDAAAPRLAAELPGYTYAQKRQLLARLDVKVSVFPRGSACRWTMRTLWSDDAILETFETDRGIEELYTVEEDGEEYVMDRNSFLTAQARKEATSGYFAYRTAYS